MNTSTAVWNIAEHNTRPARLIDAPTADEMIDAILVERDVIVQCEAAQSLMRMFKNGFIYNPAAQARLAQIGKERKAAWLAAYEAQIDLVVAA